MSSHRTWDSVRCTDVVHVSPSFKRGLPDHNGNSQVILRLSDHRTLRWYTPDAGPSVSDVVQRAPKARKRSPEASDSESTDAPGCPVHTRLRTRADIMHHRRVRWHEQRPMLLLHHRVRQRSIGCSDAPCHMNWRAKRSPNESGGQF
jgi:hypothetical protein